MDTEVPSEIEGVLLEKCFEVNDVVQVGDVVAVIETDQEVPQEEEEDVAEDLEAALDVSQAAEAIESQMAAVTTTNEVVSTTQVASDDERFYSPLVRNIAKEEGISKEELRQISGTGLDGRVTKDDMMTYLSQRSNGVTSAAKTIAKPVATAPKPIPSAADEIIPLDRMGKLISEHMTQSLATSAHVQSFIEVDVTNVVNWRNKNKKSFEVREGEKLTFTPIFMEAVAIALKQYPLVNISFDGDNIIKKKNINLGMATALSDGNLIVPVIKNADQLSLVGMAKQVNDLALRARNNQLNPDDVSEGTYTVTNVGSFGSIFGTPIINQPQVAILAIGAIRKTPSVIETPEGDFIGIRHKMFLAHSYDHRVVNGALGGLFIKAVADYLENWDINRSI